MEGTGKIKLLIGSTGSVAATRLDEIVEAFLETGKYEIKVIFTKHSKVFVEDIIDDFDEYQRKHGVQFYYPKDEWKRYAEDKKDLLIIELRKWADVLLIAPLSGNCLAKISNGLCDNLLTCVVRAWDTNKKGFFCLAMNNLMYSHFLTKDQCQVLIDGYKFAQIPSISTLLKCGDVGMGGIAKTSQIVEFVENGIKDGTMHGKSTFIKSKI